MSGVDESDTTLCLGRGLCAPSPRPPNPMSPIFPQPTLWCLGGLNGVSIVPLTLAPVELHQTGNQPYLLLPVVLANLGAEKAVARDFIIAVKVPSPPPFSFLSSHCPGPESTQLGLTSRTPDSSQLQSFIVSFFSFFSLLLRPPSSVAWTPLISDSPPDAVLHRHVLTSLTRHQSYRQNVIQKRGGDCR